MENVNQNIKKLEFKYEGDFEGLPAKSVLKTQLDYIIIIDEIIRTIDPLVETNVKIAGTKEGSLEIQHFIELTGIGAILASENFKTITNAIKIFGDLIKFVGYLCKSGKSVKKEDIKETQTMDGIEINIVNNGGGSIVIHPHAIQVYKGNTIVAKALQDVGSLINELPDVKRIDIIDHESRESLLSASRDDFKALSQPNPYTSSVKDMTGIIEDQVLVIKKASLFPPKKSTAKFMWDFIYKTKKISASVNDLEFRNQLNRGLTISQGDRLIVDMKAQTKFDPALQTEVETGVYEIVKVKKVAPRSDFQ